MHDKTAESLRSGLASLRYGFESELLRFVSENSFAPDLKKRAVLVGIRYRLAREKLLQSPDEDGRSIIREIEAIIEAVASDVDGEANALSASRQMREEILLSGRFAEKTEIAFWCANLSKSFKSKFSLGPVDLTLRRGQILGVVGENGNGKTTLFRLIAGELRHDGGDLLYSAEGLRGISWADWGKIKSRIAYLPQEIPPWWGDLEANLQYEAAIHGIRGKDNQREVEYIIERLDLRRHLGQKWKTLSGGYKLRFALARALVWKPEIMILDEPLANLDVNAQQIFLNDIREIATSLHHPIAVLISSQHIHEVEAVADSLVFLRNGKVIFNGPVSELGSKRVENTYEIKVATDMLSFTEAFPPELPVVVKDAGLHFLVQTPLDVSKQSILRHISDSGLSLEYFRDISNSSKRLFMERTV